MLNILGLILKNLKRPPDRYIPLILLVVGVAGSLALLGLSVDAVVQGVLVTGAAVYGDQLFKQLGRKE